MAVVVVKAAASKTVIVQQLQGPAGASAVTPTGTGLFHIVGGVAVAVASLLVDADVSASAAIAVSKLAPGTNGFTLQTIGGITVWAAAPSLTLSGDVTGPLGTNVVVAVNGATVPISGALHTGNGLYVSGVSALTYSALNLAGGANFVSGALPFTNGGTGLTTLGSSLQYLRTNAGVTAVEWATLPSGMVYPGAGIAVSTGSAWGTSLAAFGTNAQVWITNAGGTAPAWVTISGDATLTAAGAVTNTKINGASVPSAGALSTGNGLYVSGASALTYSALNLAGGAGWVTGVLPVANLPSLGGNCSGAINANIVTKINGATVPIAGALTTGNGLYVSGIFSLAYSALNLAGGANFVIGTLPVGNLPNLAGDVTGTLATTSVVAMATGNATIPIATTSLAFGAIPGTTGLIRFPGAAGTNYGIIGRNQNNTADTKIISLDDVGGGNQQITIGSTNGYLVLTAANVIKTVGPTYFATSNVHFFDSNTASDASTLTYTSTGANAWTFAAGVTSVSITQAATSTASGAAFSISAQSSSFAGATGGALNVSAGNATGTGTTTSGGLTLSSGVNTGSTTGNIGNITLNLPAPVGAGTFGAVSIASPGSGAGPVLIQKMASLAGMEIVSTSGTYFAIGNSTVGALFLNGANNRLVINGIGVQLLFAGAWGWQWDNSSVAQTMTLTANTVSHVYTATATAVAAGANFTFAAQSATGSTFSGGSIILAGGASTTGTAGPVILAPGNAESVRITGAGIVVDSGAGGGSFGGATNAIYFRDAAAGPTSNPASGGVIFSLSGSSKWRGGNVVRSLAGSKTGGATTKVIEIYEGEGTTTTTAAVVCLTTPTLNTAPYPTTNTTLHVKIRVRLNDQTGSNNSGTAECETNCVVNASGTVSCSVLSPANYATGNLATFTSITITCAIVSSQLQISVANGKGGSTRNWVTAVVEFFG